MTNDNSRHRLGLVAITALSLFGALFARLWFLQIVEGETLEARVNSNAQRVVVMPAPRGRILDRNQAVLVDNRESIVVAIDSQAFADLEKPERERLLERLSTALNRARPPEDQLTVAAIRKRLNDTRFSRFRPIPIGEDISVDQEIYFREQADRFPAVVVERQTVRSYPYGSLAAHVLGYVGGVTEDDYARLRGQGGPKPYEKSDEIGKAGVEATYEEHLRGVPGRRVYEVDRSNRVVREIASLRREPKPGDDVHLSIDARIQYKTEEALQAKILASDTPTPAGAATVMDPRNGQVIAMASYPTYNPADLVGGITEEQWAALNQPDTKILSNRAIQEAYPAASTFKLATSYAGLQLGLISPDGVVVDQGTYRLCEGSGSGCLKRNSGGGQAMGPITLSTALTRSSDFYYYRVGVEAWRKHQNEGAPDNVLQEHIKVLGYGEKTGIDLTTERAGRVPDPASQKELADTLWEASPENYGGDEANYRDAQRWKAGYSADVAIGQYDTLVTPLQTANAYASLANPEGKLFRPSVLSYVSPARQPDTVVEPFRQEEIRTIDYGPARAALLDGFAGVTQRESGTAYGVFQSFPMEQWPVAGKTGTAEVGDDEGQKQDNSLFVGFGPTFDPQYVASVMIEGGGFGGEAAAPAVALIFEPIATGAINSFVIPPGGAIDAEAAADASAGIGTASSD
ncbi:MAG TPA: penicillin-binding protein 2 [Aquihabitans sp.]|jgi:penicillin-binding protein 2|nr:penicillin-binding protein 2 [Aquihabitans sp.]